MPVEIEIGTVVETVAVVATIGIVAKTVAAGTVVEETEATIEVAQIEVAVAKTEVTTVDQIEAARIEAKVTDEIVDMTVEPLVVGQIAVVIVTVVMIVVMIAVTTVVAMTVVKTVVKTVDTTADMTVAATGASMAVTGQTVAMIVVEIEAMAEVAVTVLHHAVMDAMGVIHLRERGVCETAGHVTPLLVAGLVMGLVMIGGARARSVMTVEAAVRLQPMIAGVMIAVRPSVMMIAATMSRTIAKATALSRPAVGSGESLHHKSGPPLLLQLRMVAGLHAMKLSEVLKRALRMQRRS